MTVTTVLLFCGGLLYGGVVGLLGHLLMESSVLKKAPRSDREVVRFKRRLMLRWWLRMLLDAVALFVWFRYTPVLLGAGLGIILFHRIFFLIRIYKEKHINSDKHI